MSSYSSHPSTLDLGFCFVPVGGTFSYNFSGNGLKEHFLKKNLFLSPRGSDFDFNFVLICWDFSFEIAPVPNNAHPAPPGGGVGMLEQVELETLALVCSVLMRFLLYGYITIHYKTKHKMAGQKTLTRLGHRPYVGNPP